MTAVARKLTELEPGEERDAYHRLLAAVRDGNLYDLDGVGGLAIADPDDVRAATLTFTLLISWSAPDGAVSTASLAAAGENLLARWDRESGGE